MAVEIHNTVEWRVVEICPDYAVTSDGKVWRITRPKGSRWKNRDLPFELSGTPDKDGYLLVGLANSDGWRRQIRIPRLICTVFHGPPPSEAHQAAHNDGSRSNNAAENLRWDTPLGNQRDRKRHGTVTSHPGELSPQAKLTQAQVLEILAIGKRPWGTQRKLAQKYGVSPVTINVIFSGKAWKHLPRFQPPSTSCAEVAEIQLSRVDPD